MTYQATQLQNQSETKSVPITFRRTSKKRQLKPHWLYKVEATLVRQEGAGDTSPEKKPCWQQQWTLKQFW